jgi:ribonucleoside-diphosphate reductase alpha chain
MNKEIFIKKRNGDVEKFSADKINKVLQWATEDIKGVSFEEVGMNAHLSFFDGMLSVDIHKLLIESASNLISEEKPNYQYVASRLLNYQLRKNVWGGKNPPKLYDIVKKNIDELVYDEKILTWYTKQEFDKLDEYLKHDRDFNFTYAGIKQLCDKYLVQNRVTKVIYETPQFAYMLIAMTFFKDYKEKRIDYVKKAYTYFSKHKINLPTPIMAGVRTVMKSYASCSLFTVDDNLHSIFSNNSAVGFATASRYGIGLNLSRLRATNAPIRNGEVVHTGPIPFAKTFESTVKSCHQNGIRGGCFKKGHKVLVVESVNIDGKDYRIRDEILINGKNDTIYNHIQNGVLTTYFDN